MLQTLIFLRWWIKDWRDARFLHRQGFPTWREYYRHHDTDINFRASKVKNFYFGYPYVYCIEDPNHTAYDWNVGTDGITILSEWCDKNCKGKYRFDFLRVSRHSGEWEIDELGGGDNVFVAFKEKRDLSMFLLKWS